MRIAHIAVVTPGKCGLYETTRELVAAERELGVDAKIVDPVINPRSYSSSSDRGVPLSDMEWATNADLIVNHSGFDSTPVDETDQPVIHVAHGRPLSSFLTERNGGPAAYSYQVKKNKDPRFKVVVTFWPEHVPYLNNLWTETPVRLVTAPVDTDYWKEVAHDYDFGGKRGEYNVVITDPWSRLDTHPFEAIHAFTQTKWTDAKLHIYGLDGNHKGIKALKAVLGDRLGLVQGWASDLRLVYSNADMLITANNINTRSVREAMACGCSVVKGGEDMVVARELQRGVAKALAQHLFDPAKTAKQFLSVVEGSIGATV